MRQCKLSVALLTVIVTSLSLGNAIAAQGGFSIDMSAQEQPKKPGKQAPRVQQRTIQQRPIQQQKLTVQPKGHQQFQPRNLPSATTQTQIKQREPTRQPKIQQSTVGTPRTLGQPKQFGHVTIRNTSRVNVAGTNYSVWRGGYRIHRNGYWRTFVGIGALSAVMFGAAYYYPYAYIDAPAPYCEGLTEDGCQLEWQAIPTIEGPTEFACVAYCPWQ